MNLVTENKFGVIGLGKDMPKRKGSRLILLRQKLQIGKYIDVVRLVLVELLYSSA